MLVEDWWRTSLCYAVKCFCYRASFAATSPEQVSPGAAVEVPPVELDCILTPELCHHNLPSSPVLSGAAAVPLPFDQ